MPAKPIRALVYGLILLLVGMVGGPIVVKIEALQFGAIEYVLKNLAISLPIIAFWLVLTPSRTRRYSAAAAGGDLEREGYLLG
ncbi:MAG: hypothetical protein EXQ91_09160 [Alphaproteobacteria bacterium]|nr:hypothetical protein [Alphaproteobacteria bacterium]